MATKKPASAVKLVIKPFKVQPKIPTDFENVSWNKLKNAIDSVYNQVAADTSKEELYKCVEDLCLQRLSAKIYTNLENEIEKHIANLIKELSLQASEPTKYLIQVDTLWKDYSEQMNTIRNIFLYLDRTYALQTTGIKSIWDIGLQYFNQYLSNNTSILQQLVVSLLYTIECQRRDQLIDKDSIRRVIRMLSSLSFYTTTFESIFLTDSIRFFQTEGQQLIDSTSPIYFMMRVEYRLHEALDMIHTYLESSTKTPLLHVIETHMLAPHASILVEKGLPSLLTELVFPKDITSTSTHFHTSNISNNISSSHNSYDTNMVASSPATITAILDTHDWTTSSTTTDNNILHGTNSSISTKMNKNVLSIASLSSTINQSEKYHHIKRMYALLTRIKMVDILKKEWSAFIKRTGEHMMNISDSEQEKSLIDDLMLFHDNLENVLTKSLDTDTECKDLLKSAFESVLNEKSTKSSELLVRYVDKKLRGEKGMTDHDIEICLNKSIRLFRYLQEKDIFEAFYKKMLAKRLLLGKSANYELEKFMLVKLKTECGANFTSKLEGMFQDIELSQDVMSSYYQYIHTQQQQHHAYPTISGVLSTPVSSSSTTMSPITTILATSSSNSGSGIGIGSGSGSMPEDNANISATNMKRPTGGAEFSAQVLTTGFWPTASQMNQLNIPPEFLKLQEHFTEFYMNKYKGRRLTYAHSFERCIITARFPKGKKELEVSYYQAVVLLAFNPPTTDTNTAINTTGSITSTTASSSSSSSSSGGSNRDVLTFYELLNITNMDDGELRRTLQSLACGPIGTRVLTKEPKSKDINNQDKFYFNYDFNNKLYRIKINTIQLRETLQEITQTHEEVFRDRQYQVDAVIVRTMKARKTLLHSTLISELMTQLKFPVRASDLKKRIESLIEREYLTRDRDDPSLYVYVA